MYESIRLIFNYVILRIYIEMGTGNHKFHAPLTSPYDDFDIHFFYAFKEKSDLKVYIYTNIYEIQHKIIFYTLF